MATTRVQRVVIGIIAVLLTFGTIGTYLMIILQNNANSTASQASTTPTPSLPIDPNAYKVNGPVTALSTQDLKVGDGTAVQPNDTVQVQYKGTIAQTGAKFDSSYDRGEPLTIPLSNVIAGWQQGMIGMKVGGKRRIIIPAALGYGNQSTGGIPANSDLVFEVELLAVNPPK